MARTTTVLQHQDPVQHGEPSFADVVYVLTTPSPDTDSKTWDFSSRVSSYMALFAYSLAHPKQLVLWANDTWRISETIEDATYPEIRHEWLVAAKEKVKCASTVTKLFLFAPKAPEERAKEAFAQPVPIYGPPEDGMVRVKWYPDLEATRRWPTGLGELWADVPLDCHGCVDLKFVTSLWGMENCYVVDANRDRPQLWRRRVERLSALAINVLLSDGHKVIGVVERPSEHMRVARHYRTYVKDHVRPFFLKTVPSFLWHIVTLFVTVLMNLLIGIPYALWFLLCCSPYIVFHVLGAVFTILFAIGTLIVDDIENLGYAVWDCLTSHSWCLGKAREWIVAGLEAAFLTDEEIMRRTREGSGVSEVSEVSELSELSEG